MRAYAAEIGLGARDFERNLICMVRRDVNRKHLRVLITTKRMQTKRPRYGILKKTPNYLFGRVLDILRQTLEVTFELFIPREFRDLGDATGQLDPHGSEQVLSASEFSWQKSVLISLLLTNDPRQGIKLVVKSSYLSQQKSIPVHNAIFLR